MNLEDQTSKQNRQHYMSLKHSRHLARPAEHDERLSGSTMNRVERAKQEWEATVDALPELICLVDERLQVLRVNRTVETWDLYDVTKVKGRPIHELLHAGCTNPSCELNTFLEEAAVQAGRRAYSEKEIFDPILQRHIRIRTQPVLSGRNLGDSTMVVLIRDITDRKQAEQALRRYTQRLETFNQIGQAILAATSPQEIAQAALTHLRQLVPCVWVNVMHFDLEAQGMVVTAVDSRHETRLSTGAMLPLSIHRPFSDDAGDSLVLIEDLAQQSEPSILEKILLSEQIRSYLSVPLVVDNMIIGSLNVGADKPGVWSEEDVSIVREVADLLAIATRQALLNRQLQQTNLELQQALDAKSEMIRNVSHELRTPLSIIKGYTSMLQEEAVGPLTVEQKDALEMVDTQGDRLYFMVTRLLSLQSLDKDALKKSTVHLEALLQEIVCTWRQRAAKAGIELRLDLVPDIPVLQADPNFLTQVFYNLLENAIKFSGYGGTVHIRLDREKDHLVASVADEGIGIPSKELEFIFDRFHQVNRGLNRSYRGMGIGLALCKAVIKAHDGRIWAESEGLGSGSVFYVSLPFEDKYRTRYETGSLLKKAALDEDPCDMPMQSHPAIDIK